MHLSTRSLVLLLLPLPPSTSFLNRPLSRRCHSTTIPCFFQQRRTTMQSSTTTAIPLKWAKKDNIDPCRILEEKKLLLIRHGCSYMNEHIGGAGGIAFGGPNFTDIFDPQDCEQYYRDSPLSPKGHEQAKELHSVIATMMLLSSPRQQQQQHTTNDNDEHQHQQHSSILQELELVVVSPLTRALETMQLSLLPHLQVGESSLLAASNNIPVIALPLASERLYLVSDVGRPVSQLEKKYGHVVDFESGMPLGLAKDDPWWWQALQVPAADDLLLEQNYKEWRPVGQGQSYSCAGEPFEAFHERMLQLCQWLLQRPETNIAIVGHFGVFEWLLKEEDGPNEEEVKFGNCEMRSVSLQGILQRRGIPIS
jgi:broad specificity phosphatase PhoE